jgi:hypothetical protein
MIAASLGFKQLMEVILPSPGIIANCAPVSSQKPDRQGGPFRLVACLPGWGVDVVRLALPHGRASDTDSVVSTKVLRGQPHS